MARRIIVSPDSAARHPGYADMYVGFIPTPDYGLRPLSGLARCSLDGVKRNPGQGFCPAQPRITACGLYPGYVRCSLDGVKRNPGQGFVPRPTPGLRPVAFIRLHPL